MMNKFKMIIQRMPLNGYGQEQNLGVNPALPVTVVCGVMTLNTSPPHC